LSGKAAKYPVCLGTLRKTLPLLPGWPDPASMCHDDRMFAAVSLIATCAFLRGGEFTTCAKSTREILRGKDVRVDVFNGRRTVVVAIPKPKNAWWLESVEARCFDSGGAGEFSPVTWLENYREFSDVVLDADGAAFQTVSGEVLSRDWMVDRSNVLFELAGIFMLAEDGRSLPVKASSWRAGGAHSATKAGLSGPMIMALGRWRSIAWGAYVAYSLTDLEEAAQKMWRVSDAASPESALVVGVPVRCQDDPLDVPRLRAAYGVIVNHRAGRQSRAVAKSSGRQCG
jgi:hypothetical protein